jgi:hypothetical protein
MDAQTPAEQVDLLGHDGFRVHECRERGDEQRGRNQTQRFRNAAQAIVHQNDRRDTESKLCQDEPDIGLVARHAGCGQEKWHKRGPKIAEAPALDPGDVFGRGQISKAVVRDDDGFDKIPHHRGDRGRPCDEHAIVSQQPGQCRWRIGVPAGEDAKRISDRPVEREPYRPMSLHAHLVARTR